MPFSLNSWPFSSHAAGDFPISCSCRAHLSRQRSAPFVDVEHRQHGEGPVGILRQAAITNFGKAPQAFQGQERVLNFRSDTRLAPVGFLVGFRQRAVPVGAFVGEVLRLRRDLLESLPLLLAPVGAVTVETGFLAMQQVRYFMAVMHVRRSDARAMDQAKIWHSSINVTEP